MTYIAVTWYLVICGYQSSCIILPPPPTEGYPSKEACELAKADANSSYFAECVGYYQ